MKYSYWFAFSAFLLLAACKKDELATAPNTITATINGKTRTFPSATGTYGYSPLINGYDLNLSSIIYYPEVITIRLTNPTPLKEGNYYSDGRVYPITLYIFYHTLISEPAKTSTVIITSLSSTNIKGIFSGELKGIPDSVTVISGSFNINF